jgi:hypothetical protein
MEAWLYDTMQNQRVRCRLCNHYCVIGNGKRGICGVRENRDGVLETGVYGRLIAAGDDPIEKKPIFHLMPGSRSFSIATVGCNFKCRFCQNADIAQMPADRDGRITGDLATPAAGRCDRPGTRLRQHRLHLHRTNRFFRVCLRHGAVGPPPGDQKHIRDQRVHERRGDRSGSAPGWMPPMWT